MAEDRRRRSRGEDQTRWLDRLRQTNSEAADDSEFFRLMKEAAEFDVSAIGFRHASVSTQKRQDRILDDYRGFVRVFKGIHDPGDNGDNEGQGKELDLHCFPPPESGEEPQSFKALWRLIRPYLYFVAEAKIPRSNAHKVVSYTTLCQYREAIMFWVPRKYNERGIKPPLHRHVFNQMTEMLRCLAVQKKLTRFNSGPDAKVNIGLDDIRQLIDMDVQDTVSIELSEQHHFAICIARACALRPGSLGPSPNDKNRSGRIVDGSPFLAWKDIRITRGHQQGMWTLRVTIRNLKTNKDMDAEAAVTANKTMRFRISSPQQQSNLALSTPHRLLVIGLRRGVFDAVTTVDDLFETDLHQITIKSEFLDKPVLLAGAERGMGLKDDHTPLPSLSLTKWLKLRAERIGWPGNVTFYSIRRQTAATYVSALGADNARVLMSHEPDSRTLERFYVDRVPTTDVSAIALGEEVGQGKADELMQLEATSGVTLDRLPAEKIVRLYGPELNALFRQYVRADADYPMLSRKEKRNRDRVLRRKAFLVLRREMLELHEKHQTAGERQMRKEEILGRATSFNKRLLEAYAEEQSEQGVENLDAVDFDEEFEADTQDADRSPSGVELENEADAEDQTAGHDGEITIPEELQFTDSAINYVEAAAAIPYETAAKLAMKVMLDHEMGEYRPQGDVSCPYCQDDDTVDEEKKAKTYTVGHLREHIASDFHTRYKQWQRRAKNDRNGRSFYCQYCVEVHPDGDSKSFSQLKDLTRHVQRSDERHIANAGSWTTPELSREHEELKRRDGWYDEDWAVNQSLDIQRGTTRRAKVALASRQTQVKKLPPVPVVGHPGILWVTAGVWPEAEAELGPGSGITIGPAPGTDKYTRTVTLAGSSAGIMADVPPPGAPGWSPTFPNPPYRGIIMVPPPGTECNQPGDGLLMSDWFKGKAPSARALRYLSLFV